MIHKIIIALDCQGMYMSCSCSSRWRKNLGTETVPKIINDLIEDHAYRYGSVPVMPLLRPAKKSRKVTGDAET